MRTKKINRYYCDFCKKSGCSAPHMVKHERGCTANPNRSCGLCKNAIAPLEVAKLIPDAKPYEEIHKWTDFDDNIEHETIGISDAWNIEAPKVLAAIREACGNCPACILAVIRQSKTSLDFSFDYRQEHGTFWDTPNT